MKPLVCDYLLTHRLADLSEAHGIDASVSTSCRKVSLNYSITADDGDEIAQQCRGLVLARADGLPIWIDDIFGDSLVLAWPFNRFFNLGTSHAAPVDFCDPATRYYEKLDGTLIVVYHDPDNGWCTATRRNPDGDQSIAGSPREPALAQRTFHDLFVSAWFATVGRSWELESELFRKEVTYCFELTSPENRVVVDYQEPRVTFIGARETSTGRELNPHHAEPDMLWQITPQVFLFHGAEEAARFVASRSPAEHEGLVAVGRNYERVKIKSPAYFAAHLLSSQVQASPRAVLQLELSDRLAEVLPILPASHAARAEWMVSGLRALDASVRAGCEWARWVSSTGTLDAKAKRKVYALEVQRLGLPMGPSMSAFEGRSAGIVEWAKGRARDGAIPPSILDGIIESLHIKEAP